MRPPFGSATTYASKLRSARLDFVSRWFSWICARTGPVMPRITGTSVRRIKSGADGISNSQPIQASVKPCSSSHGSPISCAVRIGFARPGMPTEGREVRPRLADSMIIVPLRLAGSFGRRMRRSAVNSTSPWALRGARSSIDDGFIRGIFRIEREVDFPRDPFDAGEREIGTFDDVDLGDGGGESRLAPKNALQRNNDSLRGMREVYHCMSQESSWEWGAGPWPAAASQAATSRAGLEPRAGWSLPPIGPCRQQPAITVLRFFDSASAISSSQHPVMRIVMVCRVVPVKLTRGDWRC